MFDEQPIEQYAAMTPLEACAALKTAPQGISDDEARTRLEQFGPNTIRDTPSAGIVRRLLAPFANWITLILLVAGGLAFLSDTPLLGPAILVVAVLNGLFTVWQEYLAERAIAALRHLLPTETLVRRETVVKHVPTAEIVPGDMLSLRPDHIVPADSLLVAGDGLRVRQTMLTGNNALVTKIAGPFPDPTLSLAERPNILLAGTLIFEGQGAAIALRTGMRTQLGEIAESTEALRAEQTPLSRALAKLAATITRVAVLAGIATFLLGIFGYRLETQGAIILAIGMIVAFVPEGLLPTVTLALVLARRRLQRHDVLVKQLAGVESLGSATILCLDYVESRKPETINATAAWAGGRTYELTGSGFTPEGSIRLNKALLNGAHEPDLAQVLQAAALCNTARLLPPDQDHLAWRVLGDASEGALLAAAARGGLDLKALAAEHQYLYRFPAEPGRPITSVVVQQNPDAPAMIYARGEPAYMLERSVSVQINGKLANLDEPRRDDLLAQIATMERAGMQVLAFATRVIGADFDSIGLRARDIERNLTILGLIGVQEPTNPELLQLIQGCRDAGIRIIVVTGAYGLAAEAGAIRAGLTTATRARIIPGSDLTGMHEAELLAELQREDTLFTQLAADQKRRIVESLQQHGHVVAFLGDSINDAPALKQADIGIAISAASTTVALAAADLVLNADHPGGLLLGIEEGRAIFRNIQKVITYIFTHNVAQVFVLIAGVLLGIPLPLTVLQVLLIDLGTEVLPSVALSTEAPEPDILEQTPREQSASLFDRTELFRVFGWMGLIEGLLTLGAYFLAYLSAGWQPGQPMAAEGPLYHQATTLAYAALVLSQAGFAFACRTRTVALRDIGFTTNRGLIISVALSLGLMLTLIYAPPLAGPLGFVPPTPAQWAILSLCPLIALAAEEFRKWIVRRSTQPDA